MDRAGITSHRREIAVQVSTASPRALGPGHANPGRCRPAGQMTPVRAWSEILPRAGGRAARHAVPARQYRGPPSHTRPVHMWHRRIIEYYKTKRTGDCFGRRFERGSAHCRRPRPTSPLKPLAAHDAEARNVTGHGDHRALHAHRAHVGAPVLLLRRGGARPVQRPAIPPAGARRTIARDHRIRAAEADLGC